MSTLPDYSARTAHFAEFSRMSKQLPSRCKDWLRLVYYTASQRSYMSSYKLRVEPVIVESETEYVVMTALRSDGNSKSWEGSCLEFCDRLSNILGEVEAEVLTVALESGQSIDLPGSYSLTQVAQLGFHVRPGKTNPIIKLW